MYLILKFSLSALIIVAIAEIARRSTLFGALVASLPLTSILAMIWLFHETGDVVRIAKLSHEIFWLVLPSLLLFVLLPVLLRRGVHFYLALSVSAVCTAFGYAMTAFAIRRIGIAM